MADLSTLDATQPSDTQLVALGAQRIRETRDATKTSFAVEHALTGEHKIPLGASGSQPAAGHVGNLFIDNVRNVLQYDSGSNWIDILSAGTVQFATRNINPHVIPNGSFVSLVSVPMVVVPSLTGLAICLSSFQMGAGTTVLGYRIEVDTIPVGTLQLRTDLVVGTTVITTSIIPVSVTAGVNFGFTLQAEGVGGTHNVGGGSMTIVVLT